MSRSTLRTLSIVVVLVIAGCQGLNISSESPSDQRAVDAVDRAREAALNVTSYQFSVDGQVQVRDGSRSESVEITGDGVVDADRQRANMTSGTRGATRVGFDSMRVAYLDGYTFVTECSKMGWSQYNLTESTAWLNYTALGQQLGVLDRANVYWNGTVDLNGVETAVVTARPTEQQLQAANNLPTGTVGAQGGTNFQNATVRVWIDTETDRILKTQREIHVRGDGASAVATVTFRFSGYDEPTGVTQPSFEESGNEWQTGCPGT